MSRSSVRVSFLQRPPLRPLALARAVFFNRLGECAIAALRTRITKRVENRAVRSHNESRFLIGILRFQSEPIAMSTLSESSSPTINAIDGSARIYQAMVMKCVAYTDGQRIKDIGIENISEFIRRDNTFVWLVPMTRKGLDNRCFFKWPVQPLP